jgi:anti-sigma regulatory factor (Ser/Thr protein kinase)
MRVEDASAIGEVRRASVRLAQELGFDEHRIGEIAIAASELASNAHVHALGSTIVLRRRWGEGGSSLELVAIDSGPGMDDVNAAKADGVSSTGTLGIGLGAIDRLANRFDLYSMPQRGTVIVAGFHADPTARPAVPVVGGLTRPILGEQVCGDSWTAALTADRINVMVADGLGHGPLASLASNTALEGYEPDSSEGPAGALQSIHTAISGTRGAAVSIIELDVATRVLRFAGIGNVVGRVINVDRPTTLLPQPGIVGQQMRRAREQLVDVPRDSLVVLHSDGLTAKWDLSAFKKLAAQPPDVIAAVLLREAGIHQDDATVVVLRVP